jgi:geranylgeranyl pyrophosphate synthase
MNNILTQKDVKNTFSKINSHNIKHKDVLSNIDKSINALQKMSKKKIKKLIMHYMVLMACGKFDKSPAFNFITNWCIKNDDMNVFNFVEKLSQYYKISPEISNRLIVWCIEKTTQLQKKQIEFSGKDCFTTTFKIFRTVFGCLIYMMVVLDKTQVRNNFESFIKRAFYFGYSYAIDDIIDDPNITDSFKQYLDELVLNIISCSNYVLISNLTPKEKKLSETVYQYLTEFSNIIEGIPTEQSLRETCLEFHKVQLKEKESSKNPNANHTYEDIIMKSYYTRGLFPYLFGIHPTKQFVTNVLDMSLLFQMYDDFRDYTEDTDNNNCTPFTHHERYNEDPYNLLLSGVEYLIDKNTDSYSKLSITLRFIQILKQSDLDIMLENLKDHPDKEFYSVLFQKIKNVPVNSEKSQITFQYDTFVYSNASKIFKQNEHLLKTHYANMMNYFENKFKKEDPFSEQILYALGGGKCTRSLLIKCFARYYSNSRRYPLGDGEFYPLMASVEYAQTASLIFDDLPAQDNATTRRGKECLHITSPEYVAQLTGLSLIFESYNEIVGMTCDDKIKLDLIKMSSECTGRLGVCNGQMKDLENSCKTIEDFKQMYWEKTGMVFKMTLCSIAMLSECYKDLPMLNDLSYNLGIAYQIRDDLLEDIEIGKKSNRKACRIVDLDREKAEEEFILAKQNVYNCFAKLKECPEKYTIISILCNTLN